MKRTIACTFALVCFGAFGANVYWSNAGTGSWDTPSNWQGGGRHERLPRGDGRARLLEAN